MGDASHVAAILLLFGAATADAQVTPPPTAAGAYQKLSAGNQKVAPAPRSQAVPFGDATPRRPEATPTATAATSGSTASRRGQMTNPWKLTAIGMAVVMATALVTGLVVANWNGGATVAEQKTPPPAAPARVASAAAAPSQGAIDACNKYAASETGSKNKTMEVVKDGAVGAGVGAALAAAAGAVAGGA